MNQPPNLLSHKWLIKERQITETQSPLWFWSTYFFPSQPNYFLIPPWASAQKLQNNWSKVFTNGPRELKNTLYISRNWLENGLNEHLLSTCGEERPFPTLNSLLNTLHNIFKSFPFVLIPTTVGRLKYLSCVWALASPKAKRMSSLQLSSVLGLKVMADYSKFMFCPKPHS